MQAVLSAACRNGVLLDHSSLSDNTLEQWKAIFDAVLVKALGTGLLKSLTARDVQLLISTWRT